MTDNHRVEGPVVRFHEWMLNSRSCLSRPLCHELMALTPNDIEDVIRSRQPGLSAEFRAGATDAELDILEHRLRCKLPESFREFYGHANGQALDHLGCASGVPSIPRLKIGDDATETSTWGEFQCIADIIRDTTSHRKLSVWRIIGNAIMAPKLVGPVKAHSKHIVFCDPGSGDVIGLDPFPASGGKPMQVVAVNHDPSAFICLAPTFADFLSLIVQSIESPMYTYTEAQGCFFPRGYY